MYEHRPQHQRQKCGSPSHGYAQIWCENSRPEALRLRVQTNPHSPGRFRTNGAVSNMPEFAKAFSCKADAPMVRQNQCRVW